MMYTLTFHRQCDIPDLPAILTLPWATKESPVVILPCRFQLQFGDLSALFFSLCGHISWQGGCPFLLLFWCMDEPLRIIITGTRCRTVNSELFWLLEWILQLWWVNVHLTRIVWNQEKNMEWEQMIQNLYIFSNKEIYWNLAISSSEKRSQNCEINSQFWKEKHNFWWINL